MVIKMMRSRSVFFFSVLFLFASAGVHGADTATECSNDFQKVMSCLSYATGKANTPTKECCASVQDIKESDPKCLCFIMQQTHDGSEQIKSMGIQEAKLLQLPSACQLQNASVSYCPKLLGLSPGSPDAAIFSNASTTATPSTSTGSSTSQQDKSNGIQNRSHYLTGLLMLATAIFVCAFPLGYSASIFHTWG